MGYWKKINGDQNKNHMGRNTSISSGEEENKIRLKKMLREGIECGVATDFDAEKHLTLLQSKMKK